jgi:tetratricopeptide (TPR) repeat protein
MLVRDSSGAWRDSLASLRTTFEAVGAQGFGMTLEGNKRKFLKRMLEERTVVVLGYSGSDDFDINPVILDTASAHRLVWIDHTGPTSSPANARVLGLVDALVKGAKRDAARCHVLRGNTTDILRSWYLARNCRDPNQSDSAHVDLSRAFAGSIARVLSSSGDSTYFAAALCTQLGLHQAAIELVSRMLGDPTLSAERRSLGLHIMALSLASKTDPDHVAAVKYSRQAIGIDTQEGFDWIHMSYDCCARSLAKLGQVAEADEMFRKAIAELSRSSLSTTEAYRLAVVAGNHANFIFSHGKMSEAIETARRAQHLYEAIGQLDSCARIATTLASALMESGHADVAIAELKRMLPIAEAYGMPDVLNSVYNELGAAYKISGHVESAKPHHARALAEAIRMGSNAEIARQYYNIALCDLALGDASGAHALNGKSRTLRTAMEPSASRNRDLAENLQLDGILALQSGEGLAAQTAFWQSFELADSVGYSLLAADSIINVLLVSLQQGLPVVAGAPARGRSLFSQCDLRSRVSKFETIVMLLERVATR